MKHLSYFLGSAMLLAMMTGCGRPPVSPPNSMTKPATLADERCPLEWSANSSTDPLRAIEQRFKDQGIETCSPSECKTSDGLPLPITKTGDVYRLPLPPGNTLHVVLARALKNRTVFLTFCPDMLKVPETDFYPLLK